MTRENGLADWNDYRLFAVVAHSVSMRSASHALHTSAQTISTRMHRLETKLGVKLFTRLSNGIALTPDGKRVLSFVEVAETNLVRASTVSRDIADSTEGECHLALGDGMGTFWFPRFVAAFGKRYPRIALRTYAFTERTAVKGPRADIQIQYSDAMDHNLVAPKVATLHFMLFASRAYLAASGTPRTAADLATHRLVDFSLPNSTQGMFASLRGFTDRAVIVANSVGTQCESIRWGGGVGLLPSYTGFVHDNLVPVVPEIHFPFPVHLCFEREEAKRPAVRSTLDFLKEVVFDRRMPWFDDGFIAPQAAWSAILNDCMERAELGQPKTLSAAGRNGKATATG